MEPGVKKGNDIITRIQHNHRVGASNVDRCESEKRLTIADRWLAVWIEFADKSDQSTTKQQYLFVSGVDINPGAG